MSKIYDLDLNEIHRIDSGENGSIKDEVMRVPGGWIYYTFTPSGNNDISVTGVFVPYNNEFQE